MKKILIFGATGQVGTYVVDYAQQYFARKDFEVIASGRRQTDCAGELGVPYVSVDITRPEDFEKLPQRDVYAAVLLAAKLPIRAGGQNGAEQLNTNILGVYNVLEYCRRTGVDRLLFTQTNYDMSGYFDDGVPIHATWPKKFSYTDDHAVYVIAKNAAIELMEHYYQKYGLKKFVFRLPNVYAYNAYPYIFSGGKLVKRPLYVMIDKAIAGEPLEIWGDPNFRKDMMHVYDLAQMLCKCVEADRDYGIYNASTGVPVTLEEQVRTIVDVFSPKDRPSPIVYRPDCVSGGGQMYDVTEAVEQLGYRPVYDCRKLFENIRDEMAKHRFAALRAGDRPE